eukprot:7384218-Prymnesium_polylepis.1
MLTEVRKGSVPHLQVHATAFVASPVSVSLRHISIGSHSALEIEAKTERLQRAESGDFKSFGSIPAGAQSPDRKLVARLSCVPRPDRSSSRA